MKPFRQFALDAVWNGTDRIFTLPPQIEPFRLAAIHFRFEPTGVAVARDNFIRIRYGEVAIVWQVIATSLAAATVIEIVTASPEISQYQQIVTQSAIYDQMAILPLPRMVLNELATVEFGILGGQAGDVADQGSVMIETV